MPKLTLERRRSSRFDFLIGVLPNSAQTGKLLLTGNFDAQLYNPLGRGEYFETSFEQLRPQSPELNVRLQYPNLLKTAFGINGAFHLYKRDTSYLDVESDLGIRYQLDGSSYVQVFWNNRSSVLLSVDSAAIRRFQRLPEQLDLRFAQFGVEGGLSQLDYRFNPREGWSVKARIGGGRKRILRNNAIESYDLGYLYDTLVLQSTQLQSTLLAEWFQPLGSAATIRAAFQGGGLFSSQPVYFNEQFRIGGARLLRGFDEESVFATRYGIGTIEARLLTGQNSYLYAFGDFGYVEDRTALRDVVDRPSGFGAGVTVETPAGLLGLSLAVGRRFGQPFDFRAPKVHVGYLSLF